MSGRLAGSVAGHGRRRRRLAADDGAADAPAEASPGGDARPIPSRRPTGRFPLRRVVSRSPWKIAAAGFAALATAAAAVAAGYLPMVTEGRLGPGIAAWCDPRDGRLATAVGGLLLVATGQLAWLVRWARARSLRDFRGGYRIWWWTAALLFAGGVALLSEAPAAFASTAAWLTGRTVLGSDLAYRFAPGLAALILLLPSLQRDMRGCRTSRTLVLGAAALWLAGSAATVAGGRLAELAAQAGLAVPAAAIGPGLLLAGAAAAFTGLLFHARHVVYESVEPPDLPARRRKPAGEADAATETDEAAEEGKAAKGAGRRRAGRKAADEKAAKSAKAAADESAEPPKVAKPHFVLKDQVLKESPKAAVAAKPEPAPARPQPVAAKPEPPVAKPEPAPAKSQPKPEAVKPEPVKPEPPKPAAAPAVSRPTPQPASFEEEEDDGSDGRNYRVDGPEDPLQGMSKRERRKLRKENKHRDRAGM